MPSKKLDVLCFFNDVVPRCHCQSQKFTEALRGRFVEDSLRLCGGRLITKMLPERNMTSLSLRSSSALIGYGRDIEVPITPGTANGPGVEAAKDIGRQLPTTVSPDLYL